MWRVERKNIVNSETIINKCATAREIKAEFGDTMLSFIKLFCEFSGEKVVVFSPIHNDEVTIIKLGYDEIKGGYYNPYDA